MFTIALRRGIKRYETGAPVVCPFHVKVIRRTKQEVDFMNGIALLVAALMSCPGALTAAGTGTETEPVREWQTDPDVGLPAVYEEYRADFGGCDELLYVDCTFKGELTEEQLEELNPMMIYKGTKDGLTHAVLFSEEPSEELLDKGGSDLRDYYDTMNKLLDEHTGE